MNLKENLKKLILVCGKPEASKEEILEILNSTKNKLEKGKKGYHDDIVILKRELEKALCEQDEIRNLSKNDEKYKKNLNTALVYAKAIVFLFCGVITFAITTLNIPLAVVFALVSLSTMNYELDKKRESFYSNYERDRNKKCNIVLYDEISVCLSDSINRCKALKSNIDKLISEKNKIDNVLNVLNSVKIYDDKYTKTSILQDDLSNKIKDINNNNKPKVKLMNISKYNNLI